VTSRRHRAVDQPVQTISATTLQDVPRLVGFTTVNRADRDHDGVACTKDGEKQSTKNHDDECRGLAELAEPTTSERTEREEQTKSKRRRDEERPTVVSLDSRSLSVPVITHSSRTDHRTTDHRRRTADDRADLTPAAVSDRVDSGVSGMQSSVCTLSSSATQQQQVLLEAAEPGDWSRPESTDCVDVAVGTSPVWNLSQMSMDVRSCPGGTARTPGITLLPPLFLCQYVNGYSDAMLMHVADPQRRRSELYSSATHHAASTTATHCSVDEEDSCGDDTDIVPLSSRNALTVQTKAVVEPRAVSDQGGGQSPCVCGKSHDLPPSADTDLPPRIHFPPPSSSVCHLPPPEPDCERPPALEVAVNAKTLPTASVSELERRRLLARLLLGIHDELALSPVIIDETYF